MPANPSKNAPVKTREKDSELSDVAGAVVGAKPTTSPTEHSQR
jgi:hypothetical protein